MSGMFALAWAWRLTRVSAGAKLVAMYLADGSEHNGYGSVDRAEAREWCCLPEDEFRDALLDLQDIGVEFALGPDSGRVYFRLPPSAINPRDLEDEVAPSPKSDQQRGWLYVLTAGGKTKVGISRRLGERIQWLQSGNPEKITLVANFEGIYSQIRVLERAVHQKLSEHRAAGEWFSVPPAVAVEVAASEIARLGFEISRGIS